MAHRLEAVMFDLDGTITDSAAGIINSYRHALGHFGVEPSDGEIRRWIGPPLTDGFAGLGVPAGRLEEAVAIYREYFSAKGILDNRLYPGVVEMLADLASVGVPLGLATSKLTEYAERIIDHFDLAGRFEVVVGSTRDGSRMRKEDIVGFALTALGQPVPSGAAMVGDREHDMHAAHFHGVRAIGVTWGYGSREELEVAGADALLDTPEELSALLLSAEGDSQAMT